MKFPSPLAQRQVMPQITPFHLVLSFKAAGMKSGLVVLGLTSTIDHLLVLKTGQLQATGLSK